MPFCLRGGLCRVGGIGELMVPETAAPVFQLVICQPCDGLSTADVYRAWHSTEKEMKPDTEGARQALALGSLSMLSPCMGNALQPVSEAARPAIAEAVRLLKEEGAVCAMMSGSGSAVFGAFADSATADRAADILSRRWERTFRCESCADSVVIL